MPGSGALATIEPFGSVWCHVMIPVVVAAKTSMRPSVPRIAATPSWMSVPPPRSDHAPQLPPADACARPHSPPLPSLTSTTRPPLAFATTVGTPTCCGSPPSVRFGLPRSVHDAGQSPSGAFCLMVMTCWSEKRRANT